MQFIEKTVNDITIGVNTMAKLTGKFMFLLIFPILTAFLWLPNNFLIAKTLPSANSLPPAQADIDITINTVVASGLQAPVQVTHAGDGSGRLFVVEKTGFIRIIQNGTVLPTPFLNISSLVSTGSEQGLLGLAFHPDYESNGYFYLNYTRNNGDTVIARYTVSGANPNLANSGSVQTLMIVNQPYSNHNGGQLLFGPDNYLYIGLGDGGSGGDPQNRAQNPGTLLGKMLRIDVDSSPGNAPDTGCDSNFLFGNGYTVPGGNPLADGPGGDCDEIWALGLRNPWRFSFDRLTGDMYIGDVGQSQWEEISYQTANTPGGVNFGWRCREGAHNYNFSGTCASLTLTEPIAEYNHSQGNAVTGGYVYRGALYPALQGRYFYADYGSGKIWSIYKTGPASWSNPDLELDTGFLISAFGEDEQGELYVIEYSGSNGKIRRLADANGPAPNLGTSQKTSSTPHADTGETITYTIQLNNTGGLSNQPVYLTDTIPAGLAYVSGSLTATTGSVDDSQNPILHWQGPLVPNPIITITYQVTATGMVTGVIINQAHLGGTAVSPLTLTQALFVPRPVLATTPNDFFFPGTQPGQLSASISNPALCDTCHTEPIFDSWRGSMMSQAGRDPLMWAALTIANNDAANAGEYCLRCHTPTGWLEGHSHPSDGSALQNEEIAMGVSCALCHRLVDPIPSTTDEAVTIDAGIRAALASTLPVTHTGSAMMIVDPADNRRGPFSLTAPHPAFQTDFLGQSANAVTESRLCGTCHNVDNPVLSWDETRQQFWPNEIDQPAPAFDKGRLFPIERTFDEWLNSQYAVTGVYAPQFAGQKPDGIVASCQDCHLRRTTGIAADATYNPVDRNCTTTGCLPEHNLVGGNTWVPQILQDSRWRLNSAGESAYLNNTVLQAREMLRKAATLTVTLTTSGTGKIAIVRVINETGHKLPTGYPEGRRMWLNVRAYNENDALVYESGAYDPATAILTQDTAAKIYETKQGITPELADMLKMRDGESFHFVLNNTVIKDNRIPPRGYTQAAFNQPGLRPVAATYADGQYWDDTIYMLPDDTERVSAILYYQTSSKEYIDFLRINGALDGLTLGTLWDSSKSPPEVMAFASDPTIPVYLPVITK
jgi:uncharacterized repeat protein (TIGR01451 family)